MALAFLGLIAVAAGYDWRTLHVPLWLCSAVLLTAVILAWPDFHYMPHTTIFTLVLVTAWLMNFVGFADVMILSAVSLTLSQKHLANFLIVFGAFGLVFGTIYRNTYNKKQFPLIVPLAMALIGCTWVGLI